MFKAHALLPPFQIFQNTFAVKCIHRTCNPKVYLLVFCLFIFLPWFCLYYSFVWSSGWPHYQLVVQENCECLICLPHSPESCDVSPFLTPKKFSMCKVFDELSKVCFCCLYDYFTFDILLIYFNFLLKKHVLS